MLKDGSVYVVFSNFNTPTLVNQQLGVHVSADLTSIGAPVRVGFDDESKVALCNFGRGPEQCVDSLNIRNDDFPALAVDHTTGHLAAVWTDTRIGTTGKYDIVVSESSDGVTWSDAAPAGGTVLTPAGSTAYTMPSVTFTAPGGKVVISTYRANTAMHTTNVGDGTKITISGSAADTGGGVVAGVEVSTDAGTTWHPATGTTSWSYGWTPFTSGSTTGSATLISRAIDDSGNLQTSTTGVTVSIQPGPIRRDSRAAVEPAGRAGAVALPKNTPTETRRCAS